MAVLNIDFSASSTDLIPEGQYSVVIDKVEARAAGPNSTTGAPNLNWQLTITEGDYKNRKLFLNTNLAPQSVWNLRGILEGLGVYEEGMPFVTDDASNILVQPRLAGLPATATVVHQEWPQNSGKMKASVTALRKPAGASANGNVQFR
jgi:hypothetical protein